MSTPIPDGLGSSTSNNDSTLRGDTIICCLCSTPYQRGGWDFYKLCHRCFAAFDRLKMGGRLGLGEPSEGVTGNEQRIRNAAAN